MKRGAGGLGVQFVTDERLPFPRLCEVTAAAVASGVQIVQLRDKRASARALLEQARVLACVIDGRAVFLINDRVDVAWAARRESVRVDGVHIGQSDLPPSPTRQLLGPDALIGLTANTPQHLDAVEALVPGTVDYLGVGVIRGTGTKPDHPPVLGMKGFAALAAASSLPCVAIGGIGLQDAAALGAAGAAGIAVVTAISNADEPGASALALVTAFESARANPPDDHSPATGDRRSREEHTP